MGIEVYENIFAINTVSTQYVIGVDEDGFLRHLHWGKKCDIKDFEVEKAKETNSNHSALDGCKMEYTPFGSTMYRDCALKLTFADGVRDNLLKYSGYEINNNTLKIILKDDYYNVFVELYYTVFDGFDIIERYTKITNNEKADITIEKFQSAEFSLPNKDVYSMKNINGAWGGEFLTTDTEINSGTLSFESRKGTTSHNSAPWFILSNNATEDYGDVYFGALAYSGNFKVAVSRDLFGVTRAIIGQNDFDYSYTLKSGESLNSPKVYCGYTNGFSKMSNKMNRFSVTLLLPKQFNSEPLPVLYNSWETTGFDINCDEQLRIAKLASDIGCELFVVDDGWFGKRNNDRAGLGDWFVNKEKFKTGLTPLIDGVKKLNMKFGLWFEPEMVNPDSDLYRNHRDWTYHYDTRKPSELRHQLVLNLTKKEVKDYVYKSVDDMLNQYDISYVKWDMNRPFSEIGTDNLENGKELWYRHTMAVYEIVDRLKEKHMNVQFEACASGGGRADLGAMSHFDMVWTSDNTDPLDRLEIQKGFSYLYPRKCMRCWVTDWNKGTRPVSLDFRFNVSMQGSLGLGGNLFNYSKDELEKSKQYIAFYKEIRPLVQFGHLYRLSNFDNGEIFANQYVDSNKSNSVVFITGGANSFFQYKFQNIKLKGLDENLVYVVDMGKKKIEKTGSFLMNVGIRFENNKAFSSNIWSIKEKNS